MILDSITMESPIGDLRLYANDKALVGLEMQMVKPSSSARWFRTAKLKSNEILQETQRQLRLYFKDQRTTFTLPIQFYGTDFQVSVWTQLQKIKPESLSTYGELALKLKNPAAVRAVGSAIGSNPISIIVPCHRVVGKNKALTGFSGGLERKEWLLKHEGHQITDHTILEKSAPR